MGVVYLARDPKLNRPVAIKVLPDALSLNPDNLARFDREAKLLASLNHPNIAAIYGVEEANRQQLLVLEYVPGETLAERISRGPLPIAEAIDVCRQIASAIEAAHENGVVHRDLKPGNVKVTPDGQVKVLDFGLAKGEVVGSSPDVGHSPTLTYSPTAIGVILGTAGYMSPEQARGKPVDRRTDIWSFGCVLYECLTGRRAFDGETVSDTIAKILEREPDWTALPAATPPKIVELLRRCLERDPRKRQRDIGDVRIELEHAASPGPSSSAAIVVPVPTAPARRPLRSLAVGALLLVAGAAIGVGLRSFGASREETAEPVRLSIGLPPGLRIVDLLITPDGRKAIVRGYETRPDGTESPRARLFTRDLHEFEFKPIPGTEGTQIWSISPDGTSVAFLATVAEQSAQRRLSRVPVDGATPPVAIADWDESWRADSGMIWLEGDDLLLFRDNGTTIFRLPISGAAPTPPIKVDAGGVSGYPALGNRLPNGRVFYTLENWGPRGYEQDEFLLDPKTGKAQRLLERAGNAVYLPNGNLVFTRGETLMAAPFDLSRSEVGALTAVSAGIRTHKSWGHGVFTLSSNGTLIYIPGGRIAVDRTLVVADTTGKVAPFSTERRSFETTPTVAPGGRRAAVVIPNAKGTYETWIADLDRPGLARALALGDADAADTAWSPDGQRLAYQRQARAKGDGVYVQAADGSGTPLLVLGNDAFETSIGPISWTADGKAVLAYRSGNGKVDLLLAQVPTSGAPGEARLIRSIAAPEAYARISPDGRLIAYASEESTRAEVYVAHLGADGTVDRFNSVAVGGGRLAWASDSRRLFYYNDPDQVMVVTIDGKTAQAVGTPTLAYNLKTLRVEPNEWDVLPDGRLFAIQHGPSEDSPTVFNVVLNWLEELNRAVAKK